MADLEKVYDPKAVEPDMYALWERSGAFRSIPDGRPHDRTFTIVIPPPNVTGALHLGHALNSTLQDILIRYHRMCGFNTLWQPGTDHAGIATQAVVERRIRELDGKTRHDLGREELVARIWQWKDEYEKRILNQLKLLGCSCDWGYRKTNEHYECDWSNTRFTLDDGLARAVRHQFFQLFKDGLIFRGKRLVNWDTQLQTAVSDDEVYYETVKGHFWHLKYPVIPSEPRPPRTRGSARADAPVSDPDFVIIATTRPETMLGDAAVAVHPDPAGFFAKQEEELRRGLDEASPKERTEREAKLAALFDRRGSHLAQLTALRDMALSGRCIMLPLVNRPIPLITDEWANPMLGSGCVKITPAHDPNDYEVGLRHRLLMINVLTPDGKVARIVEPGGAENPASNRYAGLSFTTEGRAKVVADLEALGLIHAIEDRETEIGHSDRSKLPIEPYLSDQWFVRTGDVEGTKARRHEGTKGKVDGIKLGDGSQTSGLAQAAMDTVTDGRIQIFPPRYAKTYLDWLGEKRDWCISRQLWWGHRIPVWHLRLSITPENAWDELVCRGIDHILMEEIPDTTAAIVDPATGQRVEHHASAGPILPQANGTRIQGIDLGRFDTGELEGTFDFFLCIRDDQYVAYREEVGFLQDPDVLDTWFSSALWPFSTLGWPEDTPHLRKYYPGSVLVTSRDIITNWVARMVMFGLYSMGKVPFDRVYITPKVLDGRGETMSKSKGNGVDPVDIIHIYGADALRYTIAEMTTETQDIRMPVEYLCPHCGRLTDQGLAIKAEEQARKSRGEKLERKMQPADCLKVRCAHKECGKEFATQWAGEALKKELGLGREASERFEVGRNFGNKMWNAARFAFMNLEAAPLKRLDIAHLPPEDRWILARLSQTIRRYHALMAEYQFSASVKELREFFWDALCDWYIELTKPRFADASSAEAATAKQVLAFCLDQALRLWHPTMPFITERLWQSLSEFAPRRGLPGVVECGVDSALIAAAFPPREGYPPLDDEPLVNVFEKIQAVVRAVRELRSQCSVPPKTAVRVTVAMPPADREGFAAHQHIVLRMAGISSLTVEPTATRPPNAGSAAIGTIQIYVHDISDDAAERARAVKTLADLDRQIAGKESKLNNDKFVANANPDVVAAERDRLAELLQQRSTLRAQLAELSS